MTTEGIIATRQYKSRLLEELTAYSNLYNANKGIFGSAHFRKTSKEKIRDILFHLASTDIMLRDQTDF